MLDGKDIIPVKLYDDRKENYIEINYTFDRVYRSWLKKLLDFVKKVAEERDKYSEEVLKSAEYSFLGTAESVADQFFYFLMKDEMSEATGNSPLDMLCKYISDESTPIEFLENRNYMINLCTKEFNAFLQGQIFDFYISMWSCFETAINAIFSPYSAQLEDKLNNSHFKKNLNFLKQCFQGKEEKEWVSNIFTEHKSEFIKKFPKYVSFSDEINFLFGEILKNYTRDKKKDKEILLYCGRLRNTLHNNGLNKGDDKEIMIGNHVFKMKHSEKVYYESYQDIMILVNEIFDIYVEILKAWNIDKEDR